MKPNTLLHAVAALLAATHITTAAEDANALAQEAWRLWGSGKPAEAVPKFKEAVKLEPRNANSWNGLGWASFNSGQVDEAEKAFENAVALDREHAAALNGLGQIHLSRRDYRKAEPFLKKAADRKASAAWYGLARLYLLEGKFAEAEKWAQMLVDSGQGDATVGKMLEAARAKQLSEGLRLTIEPPAPKR
jgi:Flp pilus assembly protein TadD